MGWSGDVALLIAKEAAVTSAIRVRRVYEDPEPGDGSRIFTDRLSACATPPNLACLRRGADDRNRLYRHVGWPPTSGPPC